MILQIGSSAMPSLHNIEQIGASEEATTKIAPEPKFQQQTEKHAREEVRKATTYDRQQ